MNLNGQRENFAIYIYNMYIYNYDMYNASSWILSLPIIELLSKYSELHMLADFVLTKHRGAVVSWFLFLHLIAQWFESHLKKHEIISDK